MSGIYINGVVLPKEGLTEILIRPDGTALVACGPVYEDATAIQVPDHEDLISAQQLHKELEIWLKKSKELAESSRGMAENYYTGIASGFSRAIDILNDFERSIIIPADKGDV